MTKYFKYLLFLILLFIGLLIFIFFIINTNIIRNKLNNVIIGNYNDDNIFATIVVKNFYKKNSDYFICGSVKFKIKEQFVLDAKYDSGFYYANKNFFVNINNNEYPLYFDSYASVFLPWKSFTKDDINVISKCNVCFVLDKQAFYKLNSINKLIIKFKNDNKVI